jgi:DNA-binding MarR family transcriptional regulator
VSDWGPVEARFDDLIHSPNRLRICAALEPATQLEFTALEESLGISTSLLSKQLKLLSDARYLALEKRPQPFGRPRTWIRLTPQGRQAYLGHVRALRNLTGDNDKEET